MMEQERLPYLRALIAVAHADGVLAQQEASQLQEQARAMALTPSELSIIRRDLDVGISVEAALEGHQLSVQVRCRLLQQAYILAWSDELMTPSEQRCIQTLIETLELQDHAPRIAAWVERYIVLRGDWHKIVADVVPRADHTASVAQVPLERP